MNENWAKTKIKKEIKNFFLELNANENTKIPKLM